jgi:catechol 2,3-dioxygenase-like lactoylglutathione lyase family enzyme
VLWIARYHKVPLEKTTDQKGEAMKMYIHTTTLLVKDQDAALDFYVNTLGFEKRDDNEYDSPAGGGKARWLVVAPLGQKTGLALSRPQDVGQEAASAGSYSGISFVTDDVARTYETLSKKGVQFTGPPQQMPWGAKATWFSDPDGNGFFLTEDQQ